MADKRLCPKCGAELSPGAAQGLCPKCLLDAGLESQAASAPAEAATGPFVTPSQAAAATIPKPERFASPGLETLAGQFPQLDNFEHLGRGGMGVVYKARQRNLNRPVAVKILPPSAGDDPAFAERFAREAQSLARLNHPNIVQVHDFGRTEAYFYFIMEYVDGVNLRALIRDGKLKPEEALKIVPQICEALQFAHDEGIVHRDIKPENILIDKKGRVKIADFGLAKLLGLAADDLSLTGTGQLMGTLGYMAPEQLQQAHAVDHRADIYSLGVVFYEMLTGQLPIGRFEPPSKKVQVDVRLDEIVLRTLESEPARRYQHASEVKSDVETVTSKPQVAPAAQVEAACAMDSGARLLLDETDRAARRFQHYFEISGFIVIAFGVVIAVLVWSVNMLGLLPIPIALSIAGVACLVAAGRIRQQWEIDYLGHSVRFENSVYTSGRLIIDGKTMAAGGIGLQTELNARIPNGLGAGDRIVVKTHAGFLSFRCQLFVEPKASSAAIGTDRVRISSVRKDDHVSSRTATHPISPILGRLAKFTTTEAFAWICAIAAICFCAMGIFLPVIMLKSSTPLRSIVLTFVVGQTGAVLFGILGRRVMKLAIPVALIVMGALVILVPVVSHSYENTQYRQMVVDLSKASPQGFANSNALQVPQTGPMVVDPIYVLIGAWMILGGALWPLLANVLDRLFGRARRFQTTPATNEMQQPPADARLNSSN